MDYLERLNPPQRRAVETTEGPVRVIAGAGTGKTGALTARFCYIADMLGVAPGSILCVTFTNKAAGEMKKRIKRILGDFDLSYICTFHSFCVRLLKEDIHVLNYPSNFVIADEEDRSKLLLKVYEDMGLTLRDLPIKRAADYVENRKLLPENYIHLVLEQDNAATRARAERSADLMEQIFIRYICEQKKNYACDFDDIINFAAYILENKPHILAKWQERMQYVMVDEFQDVSPRQYAIARMLAGGHRNLFIVGDPDQTIYSWRGADVRMLLDFDKVFPEAVTIVLDDNYRSTPQILRPSNELIRRNSTRYPKQLRALRADGPRARFFHARTEKEEAAWIARHIKALARQGVALRDIAVIYRAHFVSRNLEEMFLRREIPHKIYSGTAFYARAEVKDVICYLRMLTAGDDMAFERTVNNPSRGIGRKRMALIKNIAEQDGITMYEALCRNIGAPEFQKTKAREYINAIEEARRRAPDMALGDIMQLVLDLSGYERNLRNLSEWERLDNLAELKRAIEESGRDDDQTLDAFIAHTALVTNADLDGADNDAVKMMTVHAAKGMEFRHVFVCGLCEGVFPSKRSATPDEMEEERRLAYVAFTRARDMLWTSDSEGRNHDNSFKAPSRFIYDAGPDNFDMERPLPEQAPPPVAASPSAGGARFAGGDAVEHPVFGPGLIIEVNDREQTYTVQFAKLPTARTLRFAAPLTPSDPDKWKE